MQILQIFAVQDSGVSLFESYLSKYLTSIQFTKSNSYLPKLYNVLLKYITENLKLQLANLIRFPYCKIPCLLLQKIQLFNFEYL